MLRSRRWSEREVCIVERDLMIGFFLLRRLIELNLVVGHKEQAASCFFLQGTWQGGHLAEPMPAFATLRHGERDCRNQETSLRFKPVRSCLYQFCGADESRNWSDVFLVSDFDRNDCLWCVPVFEIESLFLLASEDYPDMVRAKFNPKRGDYDVTTPNRLAGLTRTSGTAGPTAGPADSVTANWLDCPRTSPEPQNTRSGLAGSRR